MTRVSSSAAEADKIATRRRVGYVLAAALILDAIYTALNYRTAVGHGSPIWLELPGYAVGGVLLGLFAVWARGSYAREAALRDDARARRLARHL